MSVCAIQTTPIGVIYRATNLVTGKVYIGLTTVSRYDRWRGHLTAAGLGIGKPGSIQEAIRCHGVDVFRVETVYEASSKDDLIQAEIRLIREHGSYGRGYNLTPGGELEPEVTVRRSRMNGTWRDARVPKSGWRFFRETDLREASDICEMCEVQSIRYQLTLSHPEYQSLRVGRECAALMTGNAVEAKRRESSLKGQGRRKPASEGSPECLDCGSEDWILQDTYQCTQCHSDRMTGKFPDCDRCGQPIEESWMGSLCGYCQHVWDKGMSE